MKEESLLDIIIDSNFDQLYKVLVSGRFFIDLKSMKEYIKFYLIADYTQGKSSERYSLNQYLKETNKKYSGPIENDTEGKFFRSLYEEVVYNFKNLNLEKKMESSKNKGNNKSENYNSKPLYKFQFDEFKVLNELKKDNENLRSTTYKRIINENGNLNLINFSNYRNFVDKLREKIDKKEFEYKNIDYYKLERRMHFEFIKCMLKVYHEYQTEAPEMKLLRLKELSILFYLPLLKERQMYAEKYIELDSEERVRWYVEIEGLIRFLGFNLAACMAEIYNCNYSKEEIKICSKKELIQKYNEVLPEEFIQKECLYKDCNYEEKLQGIFTEKELNNFKNLYKYESYKNDYKLKMNFDAKDWIDLTKYLDTHNV